MRRPLKVLTTLLVLYLIAFLAVIGVSVGLNIRFLYILIALEIISIICVIVLICSNKLADYKLSWIVFIGFVPIIGITSYFFFGRKYKPNQAAEHYYQSVMEPIRKHTALQTTNFLAKSKINDPISQKVFQWNYNTDHMPIWHDQSNTHIFTSGSGFFSQLLRDISAAQKYIYLNFYILEDGEILDMIKAALIERAKKGVKIYIIYDHAGSIYFLRQKTINLLREAGVNIVKNAPINRSLLKSRLHYRIHRKDVVIDYNIFYTGGINISDHWISASSRLGFYNDLQIRVTGPSAIVVAAIFAKNWFIANKRERIIDFALLNQLLSGHKKLADNNKFFTISRQEPRGNHSSHKTIYKSLIENANHRIFISTPYFIPPRDIVESLIAAAERGVDVKILIPGITDKAFILDLTRLYCLDLFQAGVKIYEINGSFNHGKTVLIDDNIVIIGSTNFDYRSFYIDEQTMAIISNSELNANFNDWWNWNWTHATAWSKSVLSEKNIFYISLLRLFKIFAPMA